MSKKILKVWGKGPIKIMDTSLDCYILEDGTPILNKVKMTKALGRSWRGKSRSDSPAFIGAVNLQPFIKPSLEEKLRGIEFYDGAKLSSGYHSDVLVDVCEVYLAARQAGVLTPNQQPTALVCELLMRAFANIGIKAFIYEQLGYEKFKHPEAFRMLVEYYLDEGIREWTKEFPNEFFWQLDRIYGNERTTSRNRPQYYALFIRKYIYAPIENGLLLKALDEKVPKDEKGRKTKRLHSATSIEVGLPAVRSQMFQVMATLKVSSNKRTFQQNYNRMMGNAYQPSLFE